MKLFSTLTAAVLAVSVFAQQLVPGTYKITSALGPNNVLTSEFAGAAITVEAELEANSPTQLWTLTAVPGLGAGNFTFTNVASGGFIFAPVAAINGPLLDFSTPSNFFTRAGAPFPEPPGPFFRIILNGQLVIAFEPPIPNSAILLPTTEAQGSTPPVNNQVWHFARVDSD
ncbi:hypothetical protein EXIGLDRAFT_722597 [Exidia glandulosa HHB12029]|uniref:Ricin B lectin domain-containing protein n=1 Tax=Exidia glandulosa HHB12029 TaxID=1314781 RepID=A0A165F7X0_EXIGL|nr:hypothetical protein EXIGLDRAFT_722597 [Exidia glandulosa HHB12029]